MQRADFDNPQVAAATNPSNFGHHHGPIPNPNPGWIPPRQANWIGPGRAPAITAADNANPPNPASVLSGYNTLVCEIDVNGGQMCGICLADQPSLRRHIRQAHPGAVTNPARTNLTRPEIVAGENAIKHYVLSQGWRTARFLAEPGRGPPGSMVGRYADFLENLAATDAQFAAQFGTQFHREPVSPTVRRPGQAHAARKVKSQDNDVIPDLIYQQLADELIAQQNACDQPPMPSICPDHTPNHLPVSASSIPILPDKTTSEPEPDPTRAYAQPLQPINSNGQRRVPPTPASSGKRKRGVSPPPPPGSSPGSPAAAAASRRRRPVKQPRSRRSARQAGIASDGAAIA